MAEYNRIKDTTLSAFFSKLKAFFWHKDDVVNVPLATVATTGDYNDLINKPGGGEIFYERENICYGSDLRLMKRLKAHAEAGTLIGCSFASAGDDLDGVPRIGNKILSCTNTYYAYGIWIENGGDDYQGAMQFYMQSFIPTFDDRDHTPLTDAQIETFALIQEAIAASGYKCWSVPKIAVVDRTIGGVTGLVMDSASEIIFINSSRYVLTATVTNGAISAITASNVTYESFVQAAGMAVPYIVLTDEITNGLIGVPIPQIV